MVAVRDHAIPIEAAKIEITDFFFLVGREIAGILHRENSHVGIHRHPTVGRNINLGPIMNRFVAWASVPAGLPAGRNAVGPTERDKEKSFLAAITVLFGAAIIADVPD